MDVLLGPAHLGDVHEALDPRLQLHEGAVVGDVGHAAGVHRAQRILRGHQIPGILLQLLHAEADAVGLLVDLDDLDLHRLADRHDLGGVVDPAPRHVGDVQQAVDAAEIDEGAVLGDVLDHAVDRVALFQLGDHLGALLGAALFEDGAARDDDVAAAAIHLEDLEGLLEAHERAGVAHRAHVHLRARQEGHGAAQVDGEAALDAAEDRALDAGVVGVGLFETVPGRLAAGHLAGEHRLAARVLGGAEVDLDLVADGDVGRLAGAREFLEFDAAFHLVADVDDGLSRLDGDDLALDHRAFGRRVHFEAFVQEGLELLHASVLRHVAVGFLRFGFSGLTVGSAGLSIAPGDRRQRETGAGSAPPPCMRHDVVGASARISSRV